MRKGIVVFWMVGVPLVAFFYLIARGAWSDLSNSVPDISREVLVLLFFVAILGLVSLAFASRAFAKWEIESG